jgi:hypothetical protein
MDRAIDVALISAFLLLVLAKLLGVPTEIGVPAAFAGGIANGWRLLSQPTPERQHRRRPGN